MGGAEGTKLDLDFMDMERVSIILIWTELFANRQRFIVLANLSILRLQKTDVTNELVEELQIKTKEFLQPNPTARAKMAAVKGISKLSGQAKSNTYPQAEGLLADCMLLYGKKLGENSIFGVYNNLWFYGTFSFRGSESYFILILFSWFTGWNGRSIKTNGWC